MNSAQAKVALAVFIAVVTIGTAFGEEQDGNLGVKVELSAKSRYKYGERIEVAVKIRNVSTKPIYVNPASFDVLDAGVFLELLDLRGRRVGSTIAVHGRLPDYKSVDIAEYIRQRWIRLEPGYFYGRNILIPIVENPKPGRYKVTALYQSVLSDRLSPSQREQLESLGSYVLDGRVRAEPVDVTIVR